MKTATPQRTAQHFGAAFLFTALALGTVDCGHEDQTHSAIKHQEVLPAEASSATIVDDTKLEFSTPDQPRVYNSAQLDLTAAEAHFSDFQFEAKENTAILFPESVKRRMIECAPQPRKLDPKFKATATFSLISIENGQETLLQETTDRDDIRSYQIRAGQKVLIRVAMDNPQQCKSAEISFSVLKRNQALE